MYNSILFDPFSHTSVSFSDVSKNKVCSTGDPWGDVGGLWAVESDELHSDKSEKKLLTSNGSATADYAEVDAGSLRVNDDLSKSRLGEW